MCGIEFRAVGDNIHATVLQGKTVEFDFIWGGASPIDVTGFDAVLQARDDDDALIVDCTVTNGRIAIGGADGRITVTIPADVTAGFTAGGSYELVLTDPAGTVCRGVSGDLIISPAIVK